MTWTDPEAIAALAGLGGVTVGGVGTWLTARVRARGGVDQSAVTQAGQTARELLDRMQEQDDRIDDLRAELTDSAERCREELRAQHSEHQAQRASDKRECDERLEQVRADQTRLAAVVERLSQGSHLSYAFSEERGREVAGLHDVREIARRTPTPPGGWDAD